MAWPSTSARTKTWGTEILTAGDLDGQFDILHTYNNDQLNGTSGHKHSGGTNDGPLLPLASAVSGTLPVTNGGTGQSTLATFLNLIYPVGSIYCNYNVSTNPASLLGFGTWVALQGYTMVGVDGGANFTSGGTTGGELTHLLTGAESGVPAHTHTQLCAIGGLNSGGNATGVGPDQGNGTGNRTIAANIAASASSAHNNLQPFVSVYMWYRSV